MRVAIAFDFSIEVPVAIFAILLVPYVFILIALNVPYGFISVGICVCGNRLNADQTSALYFFDVGIGHRFGFYLAVVFVHFLHKISRKEECGDRKEYKPERKSLRG